MSGHTLVSNQFGHFLSNQYSELVRKSYAICQHSEHSVDLLNGAIERTIERIRKSGFTDTTKFGGYILQSVKHDFHREERKCTKRHFVSADDYQWEVEQMMKANDHNSQHHHFETELVTKYLFQYLERFYPAKHATLFKVYYTTENNTYRKIVQTQAGVTMSSVKNILSKMKQDVKRNLIKYIIHQESKEIWRDVNNYPLYQISNKLNVRNIFNQTVIPKKGIYLLENERGVREKCIEQLMGNFKAHEIKQFTRQL